MEKWLQNLDSCRYCGEESKEYLKDFIKPCIEFRAHDDWKPEEVSVLFIAESPPGHESRYFYNLGTPNLTRKKLLELLEMPDLSNFKKKGYFLTDTIKCRLWKHGHGFPSYIAGNCAKRFLRDEIRRLKPEKIVLLGKTAKEGVQQFPEFEELRSYNKVKDYCGKKILTKDCTVIMYAFPRQRSPKVKEAMLRNPLPALLKEF